MHSATLTGTVEWTVGSDHESGNATLVANADGSSQITLELGQSSRTETQTSFVQGPQCSWSGNDGIEHVAPAHNCLLTVAWFLPSMGLAGNQQPPGTTAFLAGNSIAGQSPEIDVRQQETAPSSFTTDAATLYAHLTTLDIEFNPTTFLPDSISYAIHPDANAYIDIPVQVEFSNYQTVQGVSVPFHIQRYVNGVLFLDITISRVSLS